MRLRPDDTIAAIATPLGIGAVAIVRLSGPRALQIAKKIANITPEPRHAHLCEFGDAEGEPVDRGLLLYFPGPNSFTGEDVVELHGHGGTVVSDLLLASALAHGARAAEPGEFSLRAFINDKLDLTQAEGIADLVGSGSAKAVRAAYRSLEGRFSERVNALQARLTALRVQLEGWLDFPDEELELNDTSEFEKDFDKAISDLEVLIRDAREGAVLSSGIVVVIAGPPNAGKSSLLNRLSGYDAAIVTDIPGTTRDALRENLSLDGLPITVIDTAGLRRSSDPVEIEGMRRAQLALESADRLIWVTDVRANLTATLAELRDIAGDDAEATVIQTKVDRVAEEPGRIEEDGITVIRLSAKTGDGIELLTDHLKALAGYSGETAGAFSARSRHIDALKRAERYIRDARMQVVGTLALELAAEEMRSAQSALSEITGELTSDDLLGEIFASFCIGK
ncbi:MAG TPA: tRNA uridine-5-carboxymethylaminomethyl(34) synthesis GTPase MnmE [Gammaproteobacteria bacterium]